MEEKGFYILILELESGRTIKVDLLPAKYFQPGFYPYVRQAKRRLKRRIARHLRGRKKIFWYIHYFDSKATIRDVWTKADYLDKCTMVLGILKLIKKARIDHVKLKFRASDLGCCSHHIYLDKESNLEKLGEKFSLEKII